MAEVSRHKRWRLLLYPIVLAALAWTVWLLWDAWPSLQQSLRKLDPGWLALTLIGSILSGYLNFEAFRVLFNRIRPGVYGRLPLAHFYFTAQLMKHLPGRVWGLGYQSVAGGGATVSEWVSVTIAYMVLVTWFALWMAATVLGWMFGWYWGLLAFIVGGFAYGVGWNHHVLGWLLVFLRRIPVAIVGQVCDALLVFARADGGLKRQLWGWFAAGWLLYLLAWSGFGLAWPGLTAADGIWLCALYTLAWFVGYITFISPSGLGVRELVFVLLAHRFPPDAVAGMAVLGRVVLLIVDVLLGVSFAPLFIRTSRQSRDDSE